MSAAKALVLGAIKHMPVAVVTVRHLAALMVLGEHIKPIQHRRLAAEIGIPKPSLTRIMIGLKRAGLAKGERSGDQRDMWFTITPAGSDLLAKINTAVGVGR